MYFEEFENKTYNKVSWTSKMLFLYSSSRTLQYLYLSQYSPDLSSRYYPNLILCLKSIAVL